MAAPDFRGPFDLTINTQTQEQRNCTDNENKFHYVIICYCLKSIPFDRSSSFLIGQTECIRDIYLSHLIYPSETTSLTHLLCGQNAEDNR
jgi:hypothetical protein